jgi:hypothetical protein
MTNNKFEAGTYDFKVDSIVEKIFEKSGCRGYSLELLIAYKTRDVRSFDNIVLRPDLDWKKNQVKDCFGIERDEDILSINGRIGKAFFAPDEKGYLRAKKYLKQEENKLKTKSVDSDLPW